MQNLKPLGSAAQREFQLPSNFLKNVDRSFEDRKIYLFSPISYDRKDQLLDFSIDHFNRSRTNDQDQYFAVDVRKKFVDAVRAHRKAPP